MKTSLELSNKLYESGFIKDTNWCYSRGNLLNLPAGQHEIPAYDIIYDIAIKYATELFGYDVRNKLFKFSKLTIPEMLFKVMSVDGEPRQRQAEAIIWRNCILNHNNK